MDGVLTDPVPRMDTFSIRVKMDRIEDEALSFIARLRHWGPLYKGPERSMGLVKIEVSKKIMKR